MRRSASPFIGAAEALLVYELAARTAAGGYASPLRGRRDRLRLSGVRRRPPLRVDRRGTRSAALQASPALVALLIAVLTYGVFTHIPLDGRRDFGDATRIPYWILLAGVLLYVAGPFIQTFQRSGQRAFPYPALFTHSWANFHIGAVGGLS